jgi:alpha-glucosidase
MGILRDIPAYISILRTMGVDLVRQALRHSALYAYWQMFYTPRHIGPRQPQFLGDLERYEALHSESGPGPERLKRAAGVDLYCADGVLRVEFLAKGVARVRLSRSGHFPRLSSYAIVGLEPGKDPGEGSLGAESGSIEEGGIGRRPTPLPWRCSAPLPRPSAPLVIEGRGLILEVSPHPCRLTFKDAEGRLLCVDAAGAGWQGMGVVCGQQLFPGQALYGLGEKAFGLNRRGLRMTMWNTDPANYDPGDDPIYQSTPFLISQRDGLACGVFFDNTYRAEFDLGQADRDTMLYCADGGELCYYVLAGPTLADVVGRFTELTGRMPLPARWTLGYQQSRWSYGSEDEVRHVAAELRAHRIPCDVLYLDIDYMDGYRVFTFDQERFPDPARLIADLRAQGLRTVTSVDPGVKVDPGFALCADGLLRHYFCRLPNGRLYVGPVWPGDCYFPDFPNAQVREWWGEHYKSFLDLGVAGFWDDMNEPAVFFGSTFPDAVQHNADNGPTDHRALHNVYGQCMMRAAADAMARFRPNERVLLISRAGYAGLQRYSTSWTGDNRSTWEQLRLSIPLVLNMGLSGQAFTGPDVAGFSGDASGELLARWTALGAFLPLFRNHSALGSALQEPYVYGEPYESICRRYIELRYRLLPYLYTTVWQAAETGLPMVRPLALSFPTDPRVASLDDQFLCGDALLVAPVLEQGSEARGVYLPAGAWYDFWTGSYAEGPVDLAARAPLDALPLYVRAGSVVPMGPVMQHSEEFVPETLELHVFAGDGESSLYEDDGRTQAYRDGELRITQFRLEVDSTGLVLTRIGQGPYDPGYRGYDVLLRGLPKPAKEQRRSAIAVLVDGTPVEWTTDPEWAAQRIAAGMFTRIDVRYA